MTVPELIQEYVNDPEIASLDREIAYARAVLQAIPDPNNPANIQNIVNLLNVIGSLVKRKQDIEMGRRYMIKIDTVMDMMERIVAITKRYVPSPLEQERLAYEIAKAFSLPAPSGNGSSVKASLPVPTKTVVAPENHS